MLQTSNDLTTSRTSQKSPQPPNLLPPAELNSELNGEARLDGRLQDGLSIERPRSALHSGDFTPDELADANGASELEPPRTGSRIATENAWIATSPPRDYQPLQFGRRIPVREPSTSFRSGTSPLSSSLSSSFVYQPPTSPLVQSESNEDLEFAMQLDGMDFPSGRFGSRRHTLNSVSSSPPVSPSSRGFVPGRASWHRREASFPYQAHQPRRSLTSTPAFLHQSSSPQTPLPRSRRPSFGSDSSPLQHASMVGSYEESILRGRMSTTPSRPLDFLAQIGVLGKGKCKSSLRCPAHVTLPFPAVYYSYNSTVHGRSQSDDGPSPYVGQIDLENGLPNPEEESRSRRKVQTRYAERMSLDGGGDAAAPAATAEETRQARPDEERRKAPRSKRRSGSPKAPPGGSYRIPEKGQIQIIIKNQNKTALKLFLVPYDLSGMEPGHKTFIRQRSYSTGPIIDNAALPSEADVLDRPVLRYLIHLHICSPAKGRFYLYKSIRIVFANRVPDGKEKLRNETTWPEPRFTPYKAIRMMHPPLSSSSGPGAMLAADKAFRRRSLGVSVGATAQTFDMLDGMYHHNSGGGPSSSSFGPSGGNTLPVDPIPLRLPPRDRPDSEMSDSSTTGIGGLRSPGLSSQASRPSTTDSGAATPWDTAARYEKLNKGDFGYGGNAFSLDGTRALGGAEGLLSQRLRSLGVEAPSPPDPAEEE
jgi:hypothetical protein